MNRFACFASLLTGVVVLSSMGCAAQRTPPPPADPARVPFPFTIDVHVIEADGTRERYRLDRGGQLAYAAGPAAVSERYRPLRVLTDAQRRTLWRIIRDHNLLRESPFSTAARGETRYEVHLVAEDRQHRYTTQRATSPGTAELAAAMRNMRLNPRYGDLPR